MNWSDKTLDEKLRHAALGNYYGDEMIAAADRIIELERKVHLACNQFENITVAETLEIAKDCAHKGVAFTIDRGVE